MLNLRLGEHSVTAESSDSVSIRYGDRTLPAPAPDGLTVDVVGRRDAGNLDEGGILRRALQTPLRAQVFAEFLRGARAPLVIINDPTRSTPSGAMLEPLLPVLTEHPSWRLIMATGLHRAPTESGLKRVLGSAYGTVRRRLMIHQAHETDELFRYDGPDGPVWLNRCVDSADRIVILTSVEPHFFAGYTGGRKSLIPGLAGFETVQRSHAGAMDPAAAPLAWRDNPVREFIGKHTGFIPSDRIWALQVVLDRRDRIAAAFAGEVDKTFAAGCDAARKFYVVPVERPYDIVVAAVYPPVDASLYQAQKGWEHAQAGVRDGGTLIVTAPCPEGIGSEFYARLSERFPHTEEWSSLATRPYTMGLHKLVRIARAKKRFRLMALTDMSGAEVARFGYEPLRSLADALAETAAPARAAGRILVVEDAGLTTIVVNEI